MFREAYVQRRCVVPVDGFFEWRAITGARAKQPYAIAMKDGMSFGLAGIWENWPQSYDRWLSLEPDPYDLLISYPSELMKLWLDARKQARE